MPEPDLDQRSRTPQGGRTRGRIIRNSALGIAAELLFVLAPFLVLFIIFAGQGKGASIWSAPDWSLASAVLFGQSIVKLMAGVTASNKDRPWEPTVLLAAVVLVLGLFPSLAILYCMVDEDGASTWCKIAQLIWFILAGVCFFLIGTVGQVLMANAPNEKHKDDAEAASTH